MGIDGSWVNGSNGSVFWMGHIGFSFTCCVLSIFYCFYKVRACVVNLVVHGSCIMGHGSVFVSVSGS